MYLANHQKNNSEKLYKHPFMCSDSVLLEDKWLTIKSASFTARWEAENNQKCFYNGEKKKCLFFCSAVQNAKLIISFWKDRINNLVLFMIHVGSTFLQLCLSGQF